MYYRNRAKIVKRVSYYFLRGRKKTAHGGLFIGRGAELQCVYALRSQSVIVENNSVRLLKSFSQGIHQLSMTTARIAMALDISSAIAILLGMASNKWNEIIGDIVASGMTQQEIAALVGTSQGHVSDILRGRRGKRVSFEIATRILALHKRRQRVFKAPA